MQHHNGDMFGHAAQYKKLKRQNFNFNVYVLLTNQRREYNIMIYLLANQIKLQNGS